MPLLTIPSLTKGTAATITLDKSTLFALAAVSGDAYFSDQTKVRSCIIEYNSDPGNQRHVLNFDLAQASPSASFLASDRARDDFLLERLVLVDHDGGTLVLERSSLPSGLDINFAPPAPQYPSLGISATPSLWLDASNLALSDGATVDNWSDAVSGKTAIVSAPSGQPLSSFSAPTFVASARNGRGAVNFDGSQSLVITNKTVARGSTFAVVFQMNAIIGNSGYMVGFRGDGSFIPEVNGAATRFQFGPDSAYRFTSNHPLNYMSLPSGGTVGKFGIAICRAFADGSGYNLVGIVQGQAAVTDESASEGGAQPWPFTGIRIGRSMDGSGYPNNGLVGRIGEVIFYDQALSNADTAALLASLRTRWGI